MFPLETMLRINYNEVCFDNELKTIKRAKYSFRLDADAEQCVARCQDGIRIIQKSTLCSLWLFIRIRQWASQWCPVLVETVRDQGFAKRECLSKVPEVRTFAFMPSSITFVSGVNEFSYFVMLGDKLAEPQNNYYFCTLRVRGLVLTEEKSS